MLTGKKKDVKGKYFAWQYIIYWNDYKAWTNSLDRMQ
jgi:hypothetical protein